MNPFSKHSGGDAAKNQNTYAKLLQHFPKIKFSYELKSYKKVSIAASSLASTPTSDNDCAGVVYSIIPKGKKYFLWFKNDECLFLELDNDKQIVNVTSKKTSRIFPNDTILYGTYFYHRKPMTNMNSANTGINILYYFTIETIHYYNGINLDATQSMFEKLKTLHLAFTTVTLEKSFQVDVGLPHIDTSLDRISTVQPFYHVFCIQKRKYDDVSNQYQNMHHNIHHNVSAAPVPVKHIIENGNKYVVKSSDNNNNSINNNNNSINNNNNSSNNNNNSINNNNNNSNNKYKILVVSADIQNDVYHLVDPNDVSNKLIASIPDYKTSVMMNALFRNIKENRSLDALEESDDDDEFENTNIDKFVDLTKKIKMKCVFNHRFKKWTPIECVK